MKLLISSVVLLFATNQALGKTSDAPAETATVTVTAYPTPNNVEQKFNNDANFAAQDPMQIGSMSPTMQPRQRQEMAHLKKRMDQKNGNWDTIHPRYRLLESLYGFSKYRERSMAELKRWKDMYENVKPHQKQVGNMDPSECYELIGVRC
jgi:carnosine N-methyltransferase